MHAPVSPSDEGYSQSGMQQNAAIERGNRIGELQAGVCARNDIPRSRIPFAYDIALTYISFDISPFRAAITYAVPSPRNLTLTSLPLSPTALTT